MTTSAVKRLAALYESQGSSATADNPRDKSSPTPSPARFLQHPFSRQSQYTNDDATTLLASESTPFRAHSTAIDTTADVTDELNPGGKLHFREGSGGARVKKWLSSKDEESIRKSEEYHLLSNMSPTADGFNQQSTTEESYASSATVVPQTQLPDHTPTPVSRVFSRLAPPLSLPRLDKYLSAIRPPSFASEAAGKGKNVAMFEPMDRLAATGRSLQDLETSSRIYAAWENRNPITGIITSIVLGITGSSALANLYSLQGLFSTIQVFALIVNTITPGDGEEAVSQWEALFKGTIPNILALNFTTNLPNSTIYLLVLTVIASLLMFLFIRWTAPCSHYRNYEGFMQDKRSSGWAILIVSSLLTVIYLPLSTLAVHMMVWSDDLWVVPNPYTNATTSPPIVAPLGPSDEYRDPLDFCWTSTMKVNEFNYAPLVVIASIAVFFGLGVLYPIFLRSAIRQAVPIIDPYTELGKRRSSSELELEYTRMLDRDRNPLSFLYRSFRNGWGTYESIYLVTKLNALLIVSVLNPSNCLFRTLPSTTIAVIRQILLIVVMFGFFIAQCWFAPFLEPVNNASEWCSRLNYVLTSAISLAVVLNIPGKNIIGGPVLYVIYGVTYTLIIYFTVINWGITQRAVKRLTRRIDFSIDIFSPRIDTSKSSPHARRRIWQESITTLFLTSPECKIPAKQPMHYSQARDVEYPPYLLDFAGSPGERHVENLKILRDVGSPTYSKAISLVTDPDYAWFHHLAHEIQTRFVGPDSYWKNPAKPSIPGCNCFFGNAWWIPFPPTLVIRYDDGPLMVLQEVAELQRYVQQNSSADISRRREIRMALRSLDGHSVYWPYRHIETSGSRGFWCCGGMRFKAQTSKDFQIGVLSLKRKGYLIWQNQQLGSGFAISIKYSKSVSCDGTTIGLNEDFDLTPQLAQFLALNHRSISTLLPGVESLLHDYRQTLLQEAQRKLDALTYRFLTHVYNPPRPLDITKSVIREERDPRVRRLMAESAVALDTTFERLTAVVRSEVATWWYIFWDDFWRRNQSTISALKVHNTDFDPHYPSSIAYTPLPRPALESFLAQRGMFHATPKWGDFIHNGFLNKVYVRLNDIVFHDSHQANIFHLGYNGSELDMEDIDVETQAMPSTLGTGGGTDHDDSSIRPRPVFRWEGIFDDPMRVGGGKKSKSRSRRRWLAKFGAWFGVTPRWREGMPSLGVSLDVELDGKGRYVVMGAGGGSEGVSLRTGVRGGSLEVEGKGKGRMSFDS